MLILNVHPDFNTPLDGSDAETLSIASATEMERYLALRDDYTPTPVYELCELARELGVGTIYLKDEGCRLGLGSFKALGGSYAVLRLVLEEATRQLGRQVDISELHSSEVRAVAGRMTFSCATDGNHGRSVAQGAQMVGAKAAIFVHSGVSSERAAAIARYGANVIHVEGVYDDSVAEASRVCLERGWIVVSDTSWSGYERIPGLVMQGYTAIVREALRQIDKPPTHLFVQAGVGGLAAALAGHFEVLLADNRPSVVVVEPARAACLYESARVGNAVRIQAREPTVMAMLECYEPSHVAWRILSRTATAFMTIDEGDAITVMRRLACPVGKDPMVVAGESGGVGLAGLIRVAGSSDLRACLGLSTNSRILIINTEGATDPQRYAALTKLAPERAA